MPAACDCDTLKFESALARANVIFSGRAEEVTTNWVSGGGKVTFRIDSSWKRIIPEYFTVNSLSPDQCGIDFREGVDYLVFVMKDFSYKTDRCSRSKLTSSASADLAMLGPGIPPGEVPETRKTIFMMSLAVLLSLLFVAFVVLRKRVFRKKKT